MANIRITNKKFKYFFETFTRLVTSLIAVLRVRSYHLFNAIHLK